MAANPKANRRYPSNRVRKNGDGWIRLCSAVYNDAFLAVRKSSEALRENPDNETALKEYNDAVVFLQSRNPFGDLLETSGRALPIQRGIERMKSGNHTMSGYVLQKRKG